MGCDIHGFWEAKTPGGDWIAFREVNRDRSYAWFGVVADVRMRLDSPTCHRGIPDDTSPAWSTYTTRWGRGLHSHTFLTPSEVRDANVKWWKIIKDEDLYDPDPNGVIREIVPHACEAIETLYIPPSNENVSMHSIRWAGSLQDLIGSDDIEGRVRMVIAFDN